MKKFLFILLAIMLVGTILTSTFFIYRNKKEDKKQVEGQVNFFNFKLEEIASELDKVNINELTPIDALNTLVRMKEKMK